MRLVFRWLNEALPLIVAAGALLLALGSLADGPITTRTLLWWMLGWL